MAQAGSVWEPNFWHIDFWVANFWADAEAARAATPAQTLIVDDVQRTYTVDTIRRTFVVPKLTS